MARVPLPLDVRIRGHSTHFDAATALRIAGLRDQIHPHDAYARLYRDEALADEAAEGDRDIYGHTVHRVMLDCGLVNLLDLRPALSRYDPPIPPADPALPDDHFRLMAERRP